MRAVLGQLRGEAGAASAASSDPAAGSGALGLSRLPELRAAVTAAGSPVTVTIEGAFDGEEKPLPPAVDHAAYRILQESLTNVLRHAPAGTQAAVRLRYSPDALTIMVENGTVSPSSTTSDGTAPSRGGGGDEGNGIRGMRERAAGVGGSLDAAPHPGGFTVTAVLPITREAKP